MKPKQKSLRHLFIHEHDPNLFIQKIKKLFLALFNIILGSTDEDLITVAAFWWEFDADSATLIHDGANESALGTNHSIVVLMRDVDFNLSDICLKRRTCFQTGLKLGINSLSSIVQFSTLRPDQNSFF